MVSKSFIIAEMAKEFVDEQIKSNKVVVFSKSYCPYCKMAKKCLEEALGSTPYRVIELDDRS